MAKKYYWLKLQKDFFKRHDVRIIESMDNGERYILFYLKLLVESIDHEGSLRFSETIPYDDKMLATITNTNVDIVRSAVKIFTELGLMETLEDKTVYMNEISKMIGTETDWAKKKREYRNALTTEDQLLIEKSEDIVRGVSDKSPTCPITLSDKSKSIELEREKDIDYKEKNTKKEISYFDCETLPYFFDTDFNSAWIEFMKNRKKAKHTEYSMHLLFKILEGKSKQEALDIVNKSVVSGWTGLFENKTFAPFNSKVDKFKGDVNFEIN